MKPPQPSEVTAKRAPVSSAELIVEAPVHRRAFLGWFGFGSTATVLATTLPANTALAVTRRMLNRNPLMLDDLDCAAFAPVVGEVFQLMTASGASLPATLAEATPLPQRVRNTERRAPFALLFRVATDQPLAQQIYPVEHAAFGRLEIFLVPVGREGEALLLEAIFN
jgi:hypothetical protein